VEVSTRSGRGPDKRPRSPGPAQATARRGPLTSWAIVSVAAVFLMGAARGVPVTGTTGELKLAASSPSHAHPPSRTKQLAGIVIAIDPGHNGGDGGAPQVIDRLVWNGREYEPCDTVGTQTASGYTEAKFNFDVARYLAADLETEGAKVVLTRYSNSGVGPCVTERAAIANNAHANAAISIHADGGPPTGRGFLCSNRWLTAGTTPS
jgi:N-acetylmuramoyl-L-alanine amidase